MIFPGVVVVNKCIDAAARREVAAFTQDITGEQQRELQQAARELQHAAREAARDAAQQARAQARGAALAAAQPGGQAPGEATTITREGPGPAPKVTFSEDGKTTVIAPDGSTTIIAADGKTTHIGADGEVSTTSGVPTFDEGPPKGVQGLAFGGMITFAFVAVGLPIARAIGRRVDRNSAPVPAALSAEMNDRMQRIEQSVEAVAIEVERISEGQRFTTKLLSELRTPLSVGAGEQQRRG